MRDRIIFAWLLVRFCIFAYREFARGQKINAIYSDWKESPAFHRWAIRISDHARRYKDKKQRNLKDRITLSHLLITGIMAYGDYLRTAKIYKEER